MNPQQLTREELWRYYQSTVDDQHYYLDAHQHRVAYYSGLLTAIVGSLFLGLSRSTEWFHFAVLAIVGPSLLFVIADSGIEGTFRFYRRFLETISIRAKIEDELGLHVPRNVSDRNGSPIWPGESFSPERHVESRTLYSSSKEFIDQQAGLGYQKPTVRLFTLFKWLCIPVVLFFGSLTISRLSPTHAPDANPAKVTPVASSHVPPATVSAEPPARR